MELNWRDYLMMHWPYLAMGLIAVVTAIYTVGFEGGKRAMLFAAEKAQYEAKTGVQVP